MPAALAQLIEELSAAGRRVVLVSTGSPYLLAQVPRVPAYLIAWSGADGSERAAAQALLGMSAITGRLPVSLPPLYPLGSGIEPAGPLAPAAPPRVRE
jgi:beta-N-acetylhexosaminidase